MCNKHTSINNRFGQLQAQNSGKGKDQEKDSYDKLKRGQKGMLLERKKGQGEEKEDQPEGGKAYGSKDDAWQMGPNGTK